MSCHKLIQSLLSQISDKTKKKNIKYVEIIKGLQAHQEELNS